PPPPSPCGAPTGLAAGVESLLQFVAIAVRAVAGEHFDACAEWDLVAEDTQHWRLLDDPSAKGVLRLESDDEDRVPRIGRPVRQMVQDAPRFGHARRRDDH